MKFCISRKVNIIGSTILILIFIVIYCLAFGYKHVIPTKRDVPRLIEQLFDRMDTKREDAALGLSEIGPDAKEAVPYLIKALDDVNSSVQWASAGALGSIGPEARQAVPALLKKLSEGDRQVRPHAAISLGKIGPEPGVVDALIKALDDSDPTVRGGAAIGLYYIGAAAAPALAKLTQMAEDPKEHPYVQDGARKAIEKIDAEVDKLKK